MTGRPKTVLRNHFRVAVSAGYLGYYASTFAVEAVGGALAAALIVTFTIDTWHAIVDRRTPKDTQ